MKSSALIAVFAIACFSTLAVSGRAQTMPNGAITKDNLLSALESMQSRKSKRKDAAWYVAMLEEHKVGFQLTSADEQEIRRVGTYLGKEGLKDLIEAIRNNYRETEFHGLLIPSTEPTPPNPCKDPPPKEALLLFLGKSLMFAGRSPFPAITIANEPLLIIERTPDGIFLTVTIRSQDGRVVAQVIKNEFHINPNNYYRMERPDRHTLAVFDQQGNPALSVKYLNPAAIKITGIFQAQGRPPVIVTEDQLILPGNNVFSSPCLGGRLEMG
jgi:hypothetical protein